MTEIWKTIPGFEGLYEASDQGRIRSLDRTIVEVGGKKRISKGRVLRPAPGTSRHMSVVLGRGKTRAVHCLVMLAFEGPPPAGKEVLHGNHNPADNRLANLRYGTRGENLQHDYDTANRSVSVPVIAVEADGTRRVFPSQTKAGDHYGISQPAISVALKLGTLTRKQKVRFVPCSTI